MRRDRAPTCPVCKASGLEVTTFDRPVFVGFVGEDDDYKYTTGTYYCSTCSKDGMVTFVRKAGGNGRRE